MAPSLIHEPIRRLPLWQDGYRHGYDTGLRIALETILAERANQEQTAERRGGSPLAYRHAYAAAVLNDVAKQLGARFRTPHEQAAR
jgi:hypothetical protein